MVGKRSSKPPPESSVPGDRAVREEGLDHHLGHGIVEYLSGALLERRAADPARQGVAIVLELLRRHPEGPQGERIEPAELEAGAGDQEQRLAGGVEDPDRQRAVEDAVSE